MSTVLVLLEPQALHLTRAHTAGTPVVQSIALDTREPLAARELLPAALRAALRELPPGPEATAGNDVAVLLIDAALLEMAELSLPPVSERERRALFRRDADRHVPIEGPVAVTLGDGERPLVHACAAPWLAEWQQLLSGVLPVQAVLAMPVAMTVARVRQRRLRLRLRLRQQRQQRRREHRRRTRWPDSPFLHTAGRASPRRRNSPTSSMKPTCTPVHSGAAYSNWLWRLRHWPCCSGLATAGGIALCVHSNSRLRHSRAQQSRPSRRAHVSHGPRPS